MHEPAAGPAGGYALRPVGSRRRRATFEGICDPSPDLSAPASAAPETPETTRIERVDASTPELRKTYVTRPALRWRTFLRRSRAEREFQNLAALRDAGVSCVRPLRWSELREGGCVLRSTLVTALERGARDLREVLRDDPGPGVRRRCAGRLGALLRDVHTAGFCSTTASPRNVLVLADGRVVLCDQPYASRVRASWCAAPVRQLDVYDAFFSPNRLREWSRTERWVGVLAYTAGDRGAARRLWRKISGRPGWWFHVVRQLCRLSGVRRLGLPRAERARS
mgnify:CR=1 FL=1